MGRHRYWRTVVAALCTVTVLVASAPVAAANYNGREFRDLYNSLGPPARTTRITSPPSITGHSAADARIRRLAEARGYRLRSEHHGHKVYVSGHAFDPVAATALRSLIADAGRNGHWLGVRSGYRSVSTQRVLFSRRLGGLSGATLASGRADGTIDAAMRWVAPPGYSKHHTGYTVDFSAAGGRTFGGSSVERWLRANNYAAAKRRGFIPSYPPGAGAQGPDPEPWEFVYVGEPAIRCGRHLVAGNRSAYDRCVRPPTPIELRYAALGGAHGILGPVRQVERPVAGPAAAGGRVARYRAGSIYWSPATGARALWGLIEPEFQSHRGIGGPLGYPTSHIATTGDGRARYARFQRGVIFSMQSERVAHAVHGAFHMRHVAAGGSRGALGYPTADARQIHTPRGGRIQQFERGRLIQVGGATYQIHGTIDGLHRSSGSLSGPYGYPTSDIRNARDGKGRVQVFEGGTIWSRPAAGLDARGVTGPALSRYVSNGDVGGYIGYPIESTRPVGDGAGSLTVFQRGHIYALGGRAHQVHGAVLDLYLAGGGPSGPLGYPTSELDPASTPTSRFQQFQGGTVERLADGTLLVHLT